MDKDAPPGPERRIAHIDMDAFFASIEQLDHPEWRGKPGDYHSAPLSKNGTPGVLHGMWSVELPRPEAPTETI